MICLSVLLARLVPVIGIDESTGPTTGRIFFVHEK